MQWNQNKGQQWSCMSQGKGGEAASAMILGSALPPMMPPMPIRQRQKQRQDAGTGGRARMGHSGHRHQGFRKPLLVPRNRGSLSICEDSHMTP